MRELYYSTAELSKIMHVGKSTIKRWTDEGKLHCFRTPGGHRKFRSTDIDIFRAQFNYEINNLDGILSFSMQDADKRGSRERLIAESINNAVKNSRRYIEKQLVTMYSAGDSPESIFDSYLTPLLSSLARAFASGTITTVEFQIAKNTLIHALIFFADTLPKQPASGFEMYCLTVNENLNEVELKAIELLLDNLGVTVYNLGPALTKYNAADLVEECKPDDVIVVMPPETMSFEAGQQLHELVTGVSTYGGHVYTSGFYGTGDVQTISAFEQCRKITSYSSIVGLFTGVQKMV